jgi:hypothetical protein
MIRGHLRGGSVQVTGRSVSPSTSWAPHSKVLLGYLEVVDQWEDNALLGML